MPRPGDQIAPTIRINRELGAAHVMLGFGDTGVGDAVVGLDVGGLVNGRRSSTTYGGREARGVQFEPWIGVGSMGMRGSCR
ncbi:MAG: hypothetical protein ACLP1X_00935 [Polyangiaceae bacterium]